MKELSASDARKRFGGLLKLVKQEPVLITRRGKPPTVMLSVADYEKLAGPLRNSNT